MVLIKGFHWQNLKDLAMPEEVLWLFELFYTFDCNFFSRIFQPEGKNYGRMYGKIKNVKAPSS